MRGHGEGRGEFAGGEVMTTSAYTHGGAPRKPEPPKIVIVKDGPLGAPWWWWVGLVAAYVAGYLHGRFY